MKQMMIQSKQKGFTLLELLVVITLLAVLSVGALVAYEGIGDNAQATAAANNTAGVDRAVRNYKGVTQNYPDQWDNLSNATGVAYSATQMTTITRDTFGNFAIPALSGTGTIRTSLVDAFAKVGIAAIQQANTVDTTVQPNLQHNEGANAGAAEYKLNTANFTNVSILPTDTGTGCKAGGVNINATYAATTSGVALSKRANKIHDSLENDECQFVVALGFGHDAAHSTASSTAAITTAATFVSKNVNPANNYARFIALFHVGTDNLDNATDGDILPAEGEIFAKPRLIAIVDTEGNPIDVNLAAASAN
jgi:prepilin-type N-terminal cleavage/methylation domain-containing protein